MQENTLLSCTRLSGLGTRLWYARIPSFRASANLLMRRAAIARRACSPRVLLCVHVQTLVLRGEVKEVSGFLQRDPQLAGLAIGFALLHVDLATADQPTAPMISKSWTAEQA